MSNWNEPLGIDLTVWKGPRQTVWASSGHSAGKMTLPRLGDVNSLGDTSISQQLIQSSTKAARKGSCFRGEPRRRHKSTSVLPLGSRKKKNPFCRSAKNSARYCGNPQRELVAFLARRQHLPNEYMIKAQRRDKARNWSGAIRLQLILIR